MKPDFSPTIRCYIDAETIKLTQLAAAAGISGTATMHRLYHGETQPQSPWLRRWAECSSIDPAFRMACKAELERRILAITPNAPSETFTVNLDANGDGRTDQKDFLAFLAQQHLVAGQRHVHAQLPTTVTPDGLAEQERLAAQETLYSTAANHVLRRIAV